MKCKYCYANEGSYNQKAVDMSFKTAQRAMDTMFSMFDSIETIFFFGGEPLLNMKVIEDICKYLIENYKGRYTQIGLMSNLYKLNDYDIEIIKKYDIQVSTSIDGKDHLNAYRIDKNGNETYNVVSTNIRKLQNTTGKQPVSIEATMSDLHSKYSKSRLMREIASEFNIKALTVNIAEDFHGDMKDHMYGVKDDIIDMDLFLNDGICDMKINTLLGLMTGNNSYDCFCTAGNSKLTIFPNGDIYPCHIYTLDSERKYCFGNVNTFSKHKFDEIRKKAFCLNGKFSYAKCKNCYARPICIGCLGTNLVTGKELPHNAEFCEKECQYFFELIEKMTDIVSEKKILELFKTRRRELIGL